jgi:uncharacterized protein involved in exopolysaccharide biosynthesis
MTADADSTREFRVPTLRELIAPIWRYKWAGLLTGGAVLAITTTLVALSPRSYEAEMKILVKRERVDPIVSADPNLVQQGRFDVTDDELNSEVELLKSRDLLEEVAIASGLYVPLNRDAGERSKDPRDRAALAKAVRNLQDSLRVAPVRRTTLIRVSYRSGDPVLAARVLTELARLYPEKHLTLHRPPGAYEFFTAQAERFRRELATSENQLKAYGRQEDVVAAETERQNALQQLAQLEASLQETRGIIADTPRRITDLEAQIAATPLRQTTQVRTSRNVELIGQLKSRILDLEVRQADMLRKFAPTYPPVVEVGQQLERAREALQRTEAAPQTEETTDQNPTHQWLRSELARVRAERAAAAGRAVTLAESVKTYRERARQLDEKAAAQQELRRNMRTAEENYLLYRRKQEEARISDALDRTRIANIAVAEPPAVPAVPANAGRSSIVVLGLLLAALLGVGITYLLDYISPYFRTPDEVENALDIPVLASFPRAR